MAVVVMVIITRVAVMVIVAVVMMMAVAVTLEKGSEKNPKKSSPQRKERFSSGLLIRNGARIGVISAPIISPAHKRRRNVK